MGKYIREISNGKNPYLAALYFCNYDTDQNRFGCFAGEAKNKRFREVAPVTRVSQWDADTLFIQDDADKLVQIYQAYRIMAISRRAESSRD